MKQNKRFEAYVCTVCGYLYDEESAEQDLQQKTIPFEQLDESWTCPLCGVGTALFEPIDLEGLGAPQEATQQNK